MSLAISRNDTRAPAAFSARTVARLSLVGNSQSLLKDAVVGEAPQASGVVESGTVVTAIVAGGEEVFLLGNREIAANSELDVYSEASPLGAAILGLKEGDTASYQAPNGRTISVEVIKVETYAGQ